MSGAGGRDAEVVILRRTEVQNPADGSYSHQWTALATIWAEVQDMLPSRGERVAEGINIGRRPARIRFLYRDDITQEHRLLVKGVPGVLADRNMRIIAGPATLGFRERTEVVAEDLSTEGQEP